MFGFGPARPHEEKKKSRVMDPSKQTCPHGLVRYLTPCAECWESVLKASHRSAKKDKEIKNCYSRSSGNLPCEHHSERRRCVICKGSWICAHGKNKVYCAKCDGRRLCQVCRNVTLPRCYQTCKRCLGAGIKPN